jgi:transposase
MTKTLYVGIDVSKDKLDVAIASDKERILLSSAFDNNVPGFKKLQIWIKKHSRNFEKTHFCMESTGIYHEEIADFLQEEKFIVSVINPACSKAFSQSKLCRTKTDKVDAGLLAHYCLLYEPEEKIKLPEYTKKLRRLARFLNSQIESRAREMTRLHSIKDDDVAHVLKGTISSLSESITQVKRMIKEHVKNCPELKHKVELLTTIPGIGDKTACEILAEIHIEDGQSINVKAQIAHAGLAPKEHSSGSSVKGKPGICKKGNSNIRRAIYMPAMNAIQHNPILFGFYHRLLSRGKLKMVALVAAMRKLLAIAIGVLRNNQPFQVDWATKQKENFALAA